MVLKLSAMELAGNGVMTAGKSGFMVWEWVSGRSISPEPGAGPRQPGVNTAAQKLLRPLVL